MIQIPQSGDPNSATGLIEQLQAIGWVDRTALAVLLVFFVMGLFKGLIWQVSRIGILVASYLVAGRFGQDVAVMLGRVPVERTADQAASDLAAAPGETTLYLAYVLLFLLVLIVLSLVSMLVKKLADQAGLGFFDRLGGGVLGVATGACVVLALVFVVNMFFPGSQLAQAARSSHSLQWSQQAIDWLGSAVDDDLRDVLSLRRLDLAPGDGGAGDVDGMDAGGSPDSLPLPHGEKPPISGAPLPIPPPTGKRLMPATGQPGSGAAAPASGEPRAIEKPGSGND